MAESRVSLLVVQNVEVAIDLMMALEADGHAVEHFFRPEEALARLRVRPPDVLLVSAPSCDDFVTATVRARHPRIGIVLLAPSDAARALARDRNIVALDPPVDLAQVVDVVRHEIWRSHGRRSVPARSGAQQRAPRIAVVLRRAVPADSYSDVVDEELGADCVHANDLASALSAIDRGVDGALVDATLLREGAGGQGLRDRIAAARIPAVPVELGPERTDGDLRSAIRKACRAFLSIVAERGQTATR